MIKSAATLVALVALSGCASLENAGHDSYTLRSFTTELGMAGCCELHVQSGKEYTGRTISFQSNGANTVLQVQEGASKAFKGQAISAKAVTVLPVTDLANILSK